MFFKCPAATLSSFKTSLVILKFFLTGNSWQQLCSFCETDTNNRKKTLVANTTHHAGESWEPTRRRLLTLVLIISEIRKR